MRLGEVVAGEHGGRLDEYRSRLVPFGFAGTVLVAQGGTVLLHRSYGLAARGAGRALHPEMPLLIGSLSKQFTAAAILALEAQGRLSTSDLLVRWLPDSPEDKHGITLHHLLTHTWGLLYQEVPERARGHHPDGRFSSDLVATWRQLSAVGTDGC